MLRMPLPSGAAIFKRFPVARTLHSSKPIDLAGALAQRNHDVSQELDNLRITSDLRLGCSPDL